MGSVEAPQRARRAGNVVAFGDPVLDLIVAHVPFETLERLNAEPGGCVPIQSAELEALLALPELQTGLQRVPGGSAANVAKGLSALAGGGRGVAFVGMVGRDAAGAEYRAKLVAQGVAPALLESGSGAATASCLCLVTPDGQRTMRTCLGAALELASPEQLPAADLAPGGGAVALLHCEGYCLYRPEVAEAAMRLARGAGAAVSLDLASFEVVRNCWDALRRVLAAGLVDVVFGNEAEADALCEAAGLEAAPGEEGAVEAAQRFLLRHCGTSVFSRGAEGCVARDAGGGVGRAPASRVTIQDTVGAGDLFTSGFLHAWLGGASLGACAACGCAAGTAAVQVAGAELGGAALQALRETVAALIDADR